MRNASLGLLVVMLLGFLASSAGQHDQQGTAISVPIIKAKVSLTAQTTGLPTTTLLTPTTTGLYRMSGFAVTTVPLDNNSFWCLQWNWTDGGGAQYNVVGIQTYSNNNGTNNYFPWISVLDANVGMPITYSITPSGTPTCGPQNASPIGSTFDVFFTVEQLM